MRIIVYICLSLLVICAGCGKKRQVVAGPPEKKVNLPAAVEAPVAGRVEIAPVSGSQAAEAAPDVENIDDSIKALIERLDKAKSGFIYFDEEQAALIAQNRELAIQLMTESISRYKDSHSSYSIALAAQLASMRDPYGYRFLFTMLDNSDLKLVLLSLRKIGMFTHYERTQEPDLTAVQRARLVSFLEHKDKQVRKAAIQACGMLAVEEAKSTFLAMLRSGDRSAPGRIVFWLAKLFPDLSTVEAVRALDLSKMPPDSYYWVFIGCQSLLESKDKDVVSGIRAALPSLIKSTPEEGRHGQQLIRTVLLAQPGEPLMPFLMDVLKNAKDPVAQGYALEAISQHKGPNGLELVLSFLDQPRLRSSAVTCLGHVLTDENRKDAWPRIGEVLGNTSGSKNLSRPELALLMKHYPAESREIIRSIYANLGSMTRMWLRWELEGFTLIDMLSELKAAGIVQSLPDAEQKRKLAEYAEEYDLECESDQVSAALNILGVLTEFDAEADELPCRHDRLIRTRFMEVLKEKHLLKNVKQVWHSKDGEKGPYTIEFMFGKNKYRFAAKYMGDWYDVSAVVNAFNTAMKNEGRVERFIQLDTGGQFVSLLFCDPAKFAPIAEKYMIPLSKDPDQARKLGQEYEQRVIESLKNREKETADQD